MRSDESSATSATSTVTRLFQPVTTATAGSTGPASTPIATPIATPTDNLPPASLIVEDQALAEDGQLTISRILSQQPGWVVVYSDESGEPGEILGFARVPEGESQNIVVSVEPLEATPTLYAMFHLDEGQDNTFEFPGPDRPARSGDVFVVDSFVVDLQIYFPDVLVEDQKVAEDGLVIVQQATAAEPSWLVLHADDAGEPGGIVAYAPLKVGVNEDVTLAIDWRTVPPRLHAIMYVDGGQVGNFEESDINKPIMLDDEPVATSFALILAPDIFILDQPVVNGDIVVERVIAYEPNWLVVYNQNEEETLGNIIGWSQLEPGINMQVTVTVTEAAVTPLLYVLLHEDLEDIGEFGFPRTDPVVIYEDGIHPFTFRTDPGNYLITRDQPLSSGNVITVPLAVVDQNAWVVVRADAEGELGEILGRRWVPAGLNREIPVTLNPGLLTPTLYVVLHLDAGISRVFDFPEGLDVPFQRNRNIIRAPFTLIENNGQ
jgi:hypothetical protein